MLAMKRDCSRLDIKVSSILQMSGVSKASFWRIQMNLCNIPPRLKHLHHLSTTIKLRARNIPNFSVFTISENTYSNLRIKMAFEDAPVQKERERGTENRSVIARLHPQSPRHFAWQPSAQVSQIYFLLPQSHDCSHYVRKYWHHQRPDFEKEYWSTRARLRAISRLMTSA
jgi:hypothetical protein